MTRARPFAVAATLLLLLACGDPSDEETTTGTDPGSAAAATDSGSDPTDGSTVPASDDPRFDTTGLDPLPGVTVTVTPEVRGGRVVVLVVEATNESDDDIALLALDDARGGADGDGYRVANLRTVTVDGDDAPPQVDAVFVAAGASVVMEKTFGELSPLPATVVVCLEGEVLAGGPAPSDDDPPTVRIGPRGEGAGVACSTPTPLTEG